MRGRRRARLYFPARSRFQGLLALASAAFDGLWLGLLDREGLAHVDARYYDEATERVHGVRRRYVEEEHNLQGLFPWEVAAIEAHFPAGGRIVVTGAGAGRELIGLLERGYDAVGHEPHPELVAAGQSILERAGHADRLHRCPRDAFPPDAGPCDGVVIGWGSYMLIPGRARRIALLRGARGVLEPGSPVLLSFFVRRPEHGDLVIVARIASAVRRLRRAEPVEVGDLLFPNFLHAFSREEVESELAEAGLELVHFAPEPYGHAVGRAR